MDNPKKSDAELLAEIHRIWADESDEAEEWCDNLEDIVASGEWLDHLPEHFLDSLFMQRQAIAAAMPARPEIIFCHFDANEMCTEVRGLPYFKEAKGRKEIELNYDLLQNNRVRLQWLPDGSTVEIIAVKEPQAEIADIERIKNLLLAVNDQFEQEQYPDKGAAEIAMRARVDKLRTQLLPLIGADQPLRQQWDALARLAYQVRQPQVITWLRQCMVQMYHPRQSEIFYDQIDKVSGNGIIDIEHPGTVFLVFCGEERA